MNTHRKIYPRVWQVKIYANENADYLLVWLVTSPDEEDEGFDSLPHGVFELDAKTAQDDASDWKTYGREVDECLENELYCDLCTGEVGNLVAKWDEKNGYWGTRHSTWIQNLVDFY